MMIFWIGISAEKKDSLLKKIDRKSLVSFFLLTLCLFTLFIVAPEATAQEEARVFIKDFDFVLPNRPQETEAAKLLKQRRQQLQSIISSEKKHLEISSELTKESIEAHINFLENSLADIDKEIAGEGDTKVPRSVLHDALREYKNTYVSEEELMEIPEKVMVAYRNQEYILAEAYFPEQDLEDEGGILTVAILEGDVGEVKIEGQTYYKERVIRRNFLEQIRNGVINEEILTKGVLLSMEDVPSAKTSVFLEEGEKPGTSNLVIKTQDKLAIAANLDFNNFGSRYVGRERYGTRVEITDPWWGSTLSLRGVTGNDNEDSFLVSGDWNIPINSYGTSLNLNYLNGLYVVGQDLAELGIDGDTSIYGLSLSQPLVRKKRQSLTLSVGYNNKYSKSYSFNKLDSVDDLDVYYVSFDYDSLDRYLGKNLISLGYYWGSLNPDNDAPPTRASAEHRFRKAYLSAVRIQNVYGSVNFMLKAAAQVSNQNLLPIEQMAIGGYGTVRGHETSLFLGDKGFTLSGELITAPPFLGNKIIWDQRLKQMVQFALFFDYGRVYLTDPGLGEYNDERLKGYGGGLRLYYKDIFSFKFDIARPTKKKAEGENSTEFYFLGNINLTSEEMPKLLRKIGNLWGGDDETEE